MRWFGEKTTETIMAKFFGAIEELDRYAEDRKGEAQNIVTEILELEGKRSFCQSEVVKAEKLSNNLKKLLS
jgi:hypothetical protein